MFVAAALPGGLGSAPDSHPTAHARRGPRGSTAWKIGSFGGCADDDAVALDDSNDREESCRSRAGPYAGGESPATALAAPPDPIDPRRSSRREQVADRSPARGAAARSVTTVWLGRSDLFAPRHATVGKTVRERSDRRRRRFATDAPATRLSTRCSRSGGLISRRRHRSARARTSRFSATTRSEVPATPLSLRQGAPVSQTLQRCRRDA